MFGHAEKGLSVAGRAPNERIIGRDARGHGALPRLSGRPVSTLPKTIGVPRTLLRPRVHPAFRVFRANVDNYSSLTQTPTERSLPAGPKKAPVTGDTTWIVGKIRA